MLKNVTTITKSSKKESKKTSKFPKKQENLAPNIILNTGEMNEMSDKKISIIQNNFKFVFKYEIPESEIKNLNKNFFPCNADLIQNLKGKFIDVNDLEKSSPELNNKLKNVIDAAINKKKIKKNKTGYFKKKSKHKLDQTVEYSLKKPNALTKIFDIENGMIKFRLYGIVFKRKDIFERDQYIFTQEIVEEESFGIVCPFFVGHFPEFRLKETECVKEKIYNVEYLEFKYLETLSVNSNFFILMLNFHFTVVNDMYSRKL